MQTSVTKQTLLLAVLLLFAGSAWPEWVKVEWTDDATDYIDLVTIRYDGNLRQVWQVTDLKKQRIDGVMSRRSRYEYRCDQ